MRIIAIGLVLVSACKAKEPDLTTMRNHGCLELPNAQRRALQADPNGNGLYWFERVIARDYDGEDVSFERLVRYDLTTKQTVVIKEPAVGPLHFTKQGDPLVVVKYTNRTFVHIRNGHMQSLNPDYFDVKDVEMIDSKNVAFLAGADNKWSVFTLDLDRPRPVHVVDADVLLSAVRGAVFVRDGAKAYAVDLAKGTKEPREVPSKAMPDQDRIYVVEESQVKMRSLLTNEGRTLVDDRRDWTLFHQTGSVLARASSGDAQHAYVLAGGVATALPVLRGGTAIVGTTKQGDNTWALIGHNTSHYNGDLWALAHEADVCRLDMKTKELHIETRHVPTRYAAKETAFWELARSYPGTKWQLFDVVGSPPTLSASFESDGGSDLDKLRAQVREVHKNVTSLFEDDELRTEIYFEDGKLATYRWRRDRLRGRAVAGIGDVELTDAADFDLDLSGLVLERIKDNRIDCRGKLTSLRSVTLLDVQVRCIAGEKTRAITIAKLEPSQTVTFSETFEAQDNDYLVLEVFRTRDQLVVRDVEHEAKQRVLYDFFVKLHADTRLALRTHAADNRFYVQLETHPKVKLEDVDTAIVKTAHDRIADAWAMFAVDEETELELQMLVDRKNYNWDGEQLTPAD